jgi:hypothetical protein
LGIRLVAANGFLLACIVGVRVSAMSKVTAEDVLAILQSRDDGKPMRAIDVAVRLAGKIRWREVQVILDTLEQSGQIYRVYLKGKFRTPRYRAVGN